MKTPLKFISAASFAAILVGCAEDSFMPSVGVSEAQCPIILSAAYPTVTKACVDGFEDGDDMGVFVLDYVGDNPESISDTDIHASNVRFRFNAHDNSWTGATAVYWTSTDTPADIVGYYPFVSIIQDVSALPFSVARRQDDKGENSMGGYEASDFLWAKAKKIMPTSSRVDLTFSHVMAAVRVTLEEGSGFDAGEWIGLSKSVLISNVVADAKINLADGYVSVGETSPVNIVPYENNGDWRGIVVPQSVESDKALIAVEVDGVSYALTKNEAFTYASGRLHSFVIMVNKRQGGGFEFSLKDEAVMPWLDDMEFRDGIIREYISVSVDEKGTLDDCFLLLGLNPEEIRNLKLSGEINEEDFRYIRESMTFLTALNLSDAEVYDNNQRTVIPAEALRDMEKLERIVFPKHLTVIGSCAFFGCGLIGDLVIPEGVTHIGTNTELDGFAAGHWGGGSGVFTNCFSLVGSLSLPSTLEFIEGAAFCRTKLSGELSIPENVRFIGPIAFEGTRFTGALTLPDKIEELGDAAFYGVEFSGDIIIPQGMKIIRGGMFQNGGGKGANLILPEGIIEIGDGAFRGCGFKGELKLPSTVRRLGSGAFAGNKFTNIVFPEHLNFMGTDCFANNTRLSGTLMLPADLNAVNHGCFSGCSLLEEIVFGEEILKIEGAAFEECYNLTSIVVNNPEPPLLTIYEWNWSSKDAFFGVPKDNFTVQVPANSVDAYSKADGWKEFKRISEYSNFVCRPANACSLTTSHQETLVLNADGDWVITHMPDWCSISRSFGKGKTELNLTIKDMPKGSGDRKDVIEFTLKGTDVTTKCTVSQYDYEYDEDECVALQKASKGRGVDIVFVGDGFDGEAISKGDYLDLVKEQMTAFFGVEPFTSYQDYFNVYACISLSQETGVNTANTWRHTRFNTLYAEGNLIHDDIDAVFDYVVEKSPLNRDNLGRSLVIMTLNSDEYGGSTTQTWNGAAVSICSKSTEPYPSDTRGIVQHEACGHGFGKLAEEKITKNRYLTSGEAAHIRDMQERGWYENVSVSGKMADVPWCHFIFDPRYSVAVDVYEGAFGVTRGVYRSELNSCMNYGIPYFNAISRQDMMKRILEYSGEGFTMEKFYETDSDKWGSTGTTRAVLPDERKAYVNSSLHHPVRIVKSKKY